MTDILADVAEALRPSMPQTPRAPLAPPAARPIRREGKEDLKPLSTKWRTILALELRGRTKLEIAEQLHKSYGSIVNITNTDRYREYRDEMLLQTDQEFLNLKPSAMMALRAGLTSTDERTSSANARWYFETLGYGKVSNNTGVTAEDVIARLFADANVTIEQHAHIHVEGGNGQALRHGEPASRKGLADEN